MLVPNYLSDLKQTPVLLLSLLNLLFEPGGLKFFVRASKYQCYLCCADLTRDNNFIAMGSFCFTNFVILTKSKFLVARIYHCPDSCTQTIRYLFRDMSLSLVQPPS